MSGVLSQITGYIIAAALTVAALIAAYLRGKSNAVERRRAQDGKDYIETRRRMDEINVKTHDDHGTLREFLRDRGKSGGDL